MKTEVGCLDHPLPLANRKVTGLLAGIMRTTSTEEIGPPIQLKRKASATSNNSQDKQLCMEADEELRLAMPALNRRGAIFKH